MLLEEVNGFNLMLGELKQIQCRNKEEGAGVLMAPFSNFLP